MAALMINKPGRGHDLSIADQRGVFLEPGRGAENVARVDRKMDQEASHLLTFANVQFARPRLAGPFDLSTLRIAQAGVEPGRDDFPIVRRVGAVSRACGRRALRRTSQGKKRQEN